MSLVPKSDRSLLDQLSEISTPYIDPFTKIEWEKLDREAFWLPEEALSLHGVPEFKALSETQRRQLSQCEYLHLLEISLWLENLFLQRLTRSLRYRRVTTGLLRYHLHEMREEAGHSLMFLEFMQRSGLPRVPVVLRHMPTLSMVARYSRFNSLLFWSAFLIGEEIPDRLNREVVKNEDDICPAVFSLSKAHILDEVRHITHATNVVEQHFKNIGQTQWTFYRPIITKMFEQFVRVFYFPNAALYDMAGLTPGRSWADAAAQNPYRHRFIERQLGTVLRSFQTRGVVIDWTIRNQGNQWDL